MKTTNPWKTLSSKIVYETPWITILEDKVVMPTGKDGTYSYMQSKNSVMIVAMNEKEEIFLINTYSYPLSSWGWELPGGGSEGEDTALASKRELVEETGITAERWDMLAETTVCGGLMTERMMTYLARELSFGDQKDAEDANAISDGRFYSVDSIHEMIIRGEITDGQTIAAMYFAEEWVKNQKT